MPSSSDPIYTIDGEALRDARRAEVFSKMFELKCAVFVLAWHDNDIPEIRAAAGTLFEAMEAFSAVVRQRLASPV